MVLVWTSGQGYQKLDTSVEKTSEQKNKKSAEEQEFEQFLASQNQSIFSTISLKKFKFIITYFNFLYKNNDAFIKKIQTYKNDPEIQEFIKDLIGNTYYIYNRVLENLIQKENDRINNLLSSNIKIHQKQQKLIIYESIMDYGHLKIKTLLTNRGDDISELIAELITNFNPDNNYTNILEFNKKIPLSVIAKASHLLKITYKHYKTEGSVFIIYNVKTETFDVIYAPVKTRNDAFVESSRIMLAFLRWYLMRYMDSIIVMDIHSHPFAHGDTIATNGFFSGIDWGSVSALTNTVAANITMNPDRDEIGYLLTVYSEDKKTIQERKFNDIKLFVDTDMTREELALHTVSEYINPEELNEQYDNLVTYTNLTDVFDINYIKSQIGFNKDNKSLNNLLSKIPTKKDAERVVDDFFTDFLHPKPTSKEPAKISKTEPINIFDFEEDLDSTTADDYNLKEELVKFEWIHEQSDAVLEYATDTAPFDNRYILDIVNNIVDLAQDVKDTQINNNNIDEIKTQIQQTVSKLAQFLWDSAVNYSQTITQQLDWEINTEPIEYHTINTTVEQDLTTREFLILLETITEHYDLIKDAKVVESHMLTASDVLNTAQFSFKLDLDSASEFIDLLKEIVEIVEILFGIEDQNVLYIIWHYLEDLVNNILDLI